MPSLFARKLIVDDRNELFHAQGMKLIEFPSDLTRVREYAATILVGCREQFLEENLLEQQLSELIKNAIKHGNHSNPEKRIRVWNDLRNRARFIVEDEGDGFQTLDAWNKFFSLRQRALYDLHFDVFLLRASYRGPQSDETDGGNTPMTAGYRAVGSALRSSRFLGKTGKPFRWRWGTVKIRIDAFGGIPYLGGMKNESTAAGIMDVVCRFVIEHADETISLERLSEVMGYSAEHLQRVFRSVTGVTPKQFHQSQRARILKSALRGTSTVSEAVYAAGYGSPSRVYDQLAKILGMTPAEYQKQGRGLRISYGEAKTSLGWMGLGATDRGICFLQFADDPQVLRLAMETEFRAARVESMPDASQPDFQRWVEAIEGFLAGNSMLASFPVDLRGTAFQVSVWNFLQSIPPGEVRSYRQVAEALGHPRAVRAVASACASNHVALLVPCHRVLRGDGALGGYKWGLPRKEALLARERGKAEGTNEA